MEDAPGRRLAQRWAALLCALLLAAGGGGQPTKPRQLRTIPLGMWFGSSGGSSQSIRDIMTSASLQQPQTTAVPTSTNIQSQQSTSTTPPSITTPASPVMFSEDENDEALSPYIAFNIWSYENGELKLSAVKKIPAEDVLGSEFYSKVTENPNDHVMVLADSILINGDGSSSTASLSPENVTKVLTSTENPNTDDGFLTNDFTAWVGDLGLSPSDQQLLEHLLNAANTIPETLTTPIENIFDLVSNIVDGPPKEKSTVPPVAEPSQNSEPSTTVLPLVTLTTKQTATIEPNSQSQTNATIESDSPAGIVDSVFSNVVITPEGLHIFNNSQGHPAEQPVQQVLSQLDSNAFIFNINQSSADPHIMKISLLSEDGIPIDASLLQSANLISIISNKPTIVNHNIYQILQSGASVPDPISQESTSPEPLIEIPSTTTTTMRTVTSANPGIAQNDVSTPSRRKPADNFPAFTAEEQLFLELERITSFNKILNGGVNLTTLRNISALESLALKGIFDSKPELLNAAKKKNSILKREPGSIEANPVGIGDSESHVPEGSSNLHTLQLDVLPLGINDDSNSGGQMGIDKNADLVVLETLLREQKLPKVVERAILMDILAGKPVSECILTNIDKYWAEIEEHLKNVSPLDADESPLAVIAELEKKLAEENTTTVLSNGTASTHTFITRVNVANNPENTNDKAPSKSSPNLQNCFKDRACTFAFSIALAAGTTGALSVPFLTPVLGRSLRTSLVISKPEVPNELMTVEDAQKILAAVTKYSQRNGKTLRGNHVNLRRYMSPFISYLGHKVFPLMFGAIPEK